MTLLKNEDKEFLIKMKLEENPKQQSHDFFFQR